MKIFQIAQNLQFVESPDLDERATVRAIRDALVNEQLAIQQYEAIADGASDEQVKEVLQDVANEEKVHVGELQTLLKRLDPDEESSLEDGEKEVKEASIKTIPDNRRKYASSPRRTDNAGKPIRPAGEYVLMSKQLHKYYAGGLLSSPDLTDKYADSMVVRGSALLDMGFDWTMSWEAIREDSDFGKSGSRVSSSISCMASNNDILKPLRDFIANVDESWGYVTPEELQESGIDGYYVLDIRDDEAFAEGHIKGAHNLFWQDLLDKECLETLPKDKTILLVCYVGHTASQMLVVLSLLGYDVKVLKFGMGKSPVEGVPVAGWLDYGFDVEEGEQSTTNG